jgi:hypothetical protein
VPKLIQGVRFTDGIEVAANPASSQSQTLALRPSPKFGDSSSDAMLATPPSRRPHRRVSLATCPAVDGAKGEPRVFSSSDEEAGIAAPADAAMRLAIDQERANDRSEVVDEAIGQDLDPG